MKKVFLQIVLVFLGLSFAYSQAGQVDSSFGKNGTAITGITITTTPVFQKDGKIVVAGFTGNYPNTDFGLARFNIDGTADKTFNGNGQQTTDFTSENDNVASLGIQSDGKIGVAGTTHYMLTNNNDSTVFSIARYNTDGSLDNTFSSDGKVQTDFYSNGRNDARSVVIQRDSKILLVGRAVKTYPHIEGNSVIVCYNIGGSLNKTYNGNRKQTILFNHYHEDFGDDLERGGSVISAVIQPDDKIVVSGIIPGTAEQDAVLARVNTDGSMDNTFGRLGTSSVFSDIEGFAIAILKDGKILVSGFSYYRGDTYDIIERINIDGSTDLYKSIKYFYDMYDGIPTHSNFIAC